MTNTFAPARQPRIPAGTSQGGQFAQKQNSAPEVSLSERTENDQAAHVLELVQERAAKFARRFHYSAETRDDIVQDTVYDLLNQQKLFGLEDVQAEKLVNVAVRAVAQRYLDPNVRHEDLTARKLLKQAVTAREQVSGVEMTSFQIRVLADEIRLSFPPGRRPGEMFWLENREFSLNIPVGDDGTAYGDLLPSSKTASPFAEDSSALADTVDALSIKPKDALFDRDGVAIERLTPSQVRAEAWNHLSEVTGAPKVPKGHLSAAAAKKVRAGMASRAGGVASLARAWQGGESTPEQDEALFAPFGDLTMKECQSVTDSLLRQSAYADDLWESAMTIAARK